MLVQSVSVAEKLCKYIDSEPFYSAVLTKKHTNYLPKTRCWTLLLNVVLGLLLKVHSNRAFLPSNCISATLITCHHVHKYTPESKSLKELLKTLSKRTYFHVCVIILFFVISSLSVYLCQKLSPITVKQQNCPIQRVNSNHGVRSEGWNKF